MKYKEVLRFSEDLVVLAQIIFYSWGITIIKRQRKLPHYYFILGSTIQGISSFQHRFSNFTKMMLFYLGYAIKGISVWSSTQENISISLNVHLIIQFHFSKEQSIQQRSMPYYAFFLICINTFNYLTVTTDSYFIFSLDIILVVLDANHLSLILDKNCRKSQYHQPNSTLNTTTNQQKLGQTFQFDLPSVKSPNAPSNYYDRFSTKKLTFNTKMEIFECTIRLEDYLKKEFENDLQKKDFKIQEEFFQLSLLYKYNDVTHKIKISDFLSDYYEELSNIYYFSIEDNDAFDFRDTVLLIEQVKNSESETLIQLLFLDVPQKYQRKQGRVRKQLFFDMCKQISHELGTSLNSLMTFSNLAVEDEGISEQIKTTYIYPILINSVQFNLIINNVRDFTHLGLQIFQLKLEEMQIIQTVEFINTLFEEPLQSKGIELSVQYHLKNRYLITDKERFEQIYFQLLQNAVKFTLSGQIRVNIYNNADRFILSIEDTGIGLNEVEEQNLNYLLDKDEFIKVSDNSVGSGMGLVISNMIVKQLNRGIPIKVKRLLIGTQFYFELPNDIQENYFSKQKALREYSSGSQSIKLLSQNSYIEGPLGQQSHSISQNLSSQRLTFKKKRKETKSFSVVHHFEDEIESEVLSESHKNKFQFLPTFQTKQKKDMLEYCLQSECCSRALIVDDEYYNIRCLKLIMQKYGVKCDHAFNGQESLQQIKQKKEKPCEHCNNQHYLLIFLDINMPIMDGFQTIKLIKTQIQTEEIKKVYCIATTGLCDLQTKQKCYESGMDYFMTKPLNQSLLKEILLTFFPTLEIKVN
ncbi:unnamed protein product [Paramecium primaurelia]|uniref:Uncharacterized protein n=1 Tax=Paramecium primaurelia TaxID=5886 RepID=A0A8S1M3J0_PARPR|nr:unnamed protein product [Paramecium primaurelia]